MRQMIIVIIFLSAALFQSSAQEQMQDTTRINLFNLQIPPVYLDDDFDPHFSPFSSHNVVPDTASLRLFSSYFLSSIVKDDFYNLNTDAYLLKNYHNFYLEDSRFSLVKQVIGMAQLSAVGYLAYKHIKKYGLK